MCPSPSGSCEGSGEPLSPPVVPRASLSHLAPSREGQPGSLCWTSASLWTREGGHPPPVDTCECRGSRPPLLGLPVSRRGCWRRRRPHVEPACQTRVRNLASFSARPEQSREGDVVITKGPIRKLRETGSRHANRRGWGLDAESDPEVCAVPTTTRPLLQCRVHSRCFEKAHVRTVYPVPVGGGTTKRFSDTDRVASSGTQL